MLVNSGVWDEYRKRKTGCLLFVVGIPDTLIFVAGNELKIPWWEARILFFLGGIRDNSCESLGRSRDTRSLYHINKAGNKMCFLL